MNSFYNLAKSRYSCRSYDSKEVPRTLLLELFETVRLAPSATNAQPYQFVVVTENPLREQIVSCYKGEWLSSAPVIIVVCGNYADAWRRADGKNHCDIDVAIAIDHLTLGAAEKGLGTCWVCKFDVMKCAELLEIPKHMAPVALIPIGFPAVKDNYSERHLIRKPLEEILSWEKFTP